MIDSIFAPHLILDLVAQLVEHLPFKERVLGSSPSQVTTLFSARGGIGRRARLRA